jgi:hypothetical protein
MTRLLGLLLALLVAFPAAAAGPYHRGPRGGCYTFTASGRKRYVDRSMCGEPAPSGTSQYHRGPRGGCYVITPGGNRKYFDRSLCR